MAKTPVVFRHPDDDPLKDRRAIDDASKRKMVMLLVGSVLVCGFILGGVSSAVVLAMANGNDDDTATVEPLPTLAVLPSATATLAMEAAAEVTEVVENTEAVESTAEVTEAVGPAALSEAALTATAWVTATDVPPEVSGDNPYVVSGGPSSGVVGGGIRVVTAAPQVIVRTVVSPVVVTRQVSHQVPIIITATYTHTPSVEQTQEVTASPEVTPTWTLTPSPTFTPTWTETSTATMTPAPTETPTEVPTEGVLPTDVPTEIIYPTEIPVELPTDFVIEPIEKILTPELTVEVDFSEFMEIQG